MAHWSTSSSVKYPVDCPALSPCYTVLAAKSNRFINNINNDDSLEPGEVSCKQSCDYILHNMLCAITIKCFIAISAGYRHVSVCRNKFQLNCHTVLTVLFCHCTSSTDHYVLLLFSLLCTEHCAGLTSHKLLSSCYTVTGRLWLQQEMNRLLKRYQVCLM